MTSPAKRAASDRSRDETEEDEEDVDEEDEEDEGDEDEELEEDAGYPLGLDSNLAAAAAAPFMTEAGAFNGVKHEA